MKKLLLILFGLLFTMSAHGEDTDDVKSVIESYAKFDNDYNVEGLKEVTHESFHFMMHGAGETETVLTITRPVFLNGIAEKKSGVIIKYCKLRMSPFKEMWLMYILHIKESLLVFTTL